MLDATSDFQMGDVYFHFSIDNGFEQSIFDEDGIICFYSISPGTHFEILAEKSGFTNGSVSGYVYEDTFWNIALNPMMVSFKIESIPHFYQNKIIFIYWR